MMYVDFAKVYDALIGQDYGRWAEYIKRLFDIYGSGAVVKPGDIVDLGCGTGSLSLLLAADGYNVIGVDRSDAMLRVARDKAAAFQPRDSMGNIRFVRHSMMDFNPNIIQHEGRIKAVISTLDSMNYLPDTETLEYTFQNIASYLGSDGLFIFDLCTKKAFERKADGPYIIDTPEAFYTMQSVIGKKKQTCRQYVTIFMPQHDGSYQRFDELHVQKIFLVQHVIRAAKIAKFKIIGIRGAFGEDELITSDLPSLDTLFDRLFFILKHRE